MVISKLISLNSVIFLIAKIFVRLWNITRYTVVSFLSWLEFSKMKIWIKLSKQISLALKFQKRNKTQDKIHTKAVHYEFYLERTNFSEY